MKLSIIVLTSFIFLPAAVTADRLIRYLFNSTSHTCNSNDQIHIDKIFSPGRRELGTNTVDHTERTLFTDCKRSCAGIVPGRCYVAGCALFNRSGRKLSNVTENRELQVLPTCTDAMRTIDGKLNGLITNNTVSSSCKIAISSTNRRSSCFDDVIFGVVEAVTLWNIGTSPPTVMRQNMTNGINICTSTSINIEARVNPCVDYVNFKLEGPDYYRSHTEDGIPYSLFGDDDSNKMYGRKLSRTGSYRLTVVPDGFASKTHIIQFNVITC